MGKWIDNMRNLEVAPGILRRGAESSDNGAKIRYSWYYKCQKSPEMGFHLPMGASMFRRWAIAPSSPLAPPLEKPQLDVVW